MSSKRLFQFITFVALAFTAFGAGTTAQATTKHHRAATVYSQRNWYPRTRVKVTKGTLYTSTALTQKRAKLSQAKYRKLTYLTGTQYGLKKVNGKKARYNYIVSTNGQVKGYVWHGYLHAAKKTAKRTQATTPKPAATLTVSAYRAEFLKDLNAERAQRHLAPLTEDSRYDQIAQQRSQQLLTNFDHGDATSDFIAADLFAQQGVPGLYGECISMDYLDDDQAHPSQNVADKNIYSYIYDDADSDWGHRDILLDATTTTIGIGATQKPGSEYVYGAINTGRA